MELYDRTSFRIEGIEGELDRICQSLGLSGPEDFAIPAAAWEAMKFRSSSDILPSLKIQDIDLQQQKVEEVELSEKCEDRDRDSVRVTDEVAETVVVGSGSGGGINGIRPPMIKPPPGMRVPVDDNMCSTWDLMKELAPVVEGEEGLFNWEIKRVITPGCWQKGELLGRDWFASVYEGISE
jgi:mitogen-activated protein kinase kinase kinase 1